MKKINNFCIIDDDEIHKFTTSFMLKKTNLVNNIILFSNGLEAINFFKNEISNIENIPEIVFLDVNMPVMDGWEFLEEYQLIKPMLPKTILIYMITSSVDERDVLKAKSISDLSGFLVKPILSQKIAEIIQEILD